MPLVATVGIVSVFAWSRQSTSSPGPADLSFTGPNFQRLVADSYAEKGQGSAADFFGWWDQSLQKLGPTDAQSWIDSQKKRLDSAQDKSAEEKAIGEAMWKVIKKTILMFSLDRGFEFYNVPRLNERQCLLQATLISSMLQSTGIDAGLVMVWSNEQGQTSNLGHVAALETLTNGDRYLLDASEPYPHAKHLGLYLVDSNAGDYRFVNVRYDDGGKIIGYSAPSSTQAIEGTALQPLDLAYVRSQYDFYRGERALGGLLAKDKSAAGLAKSEMYLTRSLKENPSNPLSQFSLARVQLQENKLDAAKQSLAKALPLYHRFGWTPPGAAEVLSSPK